MVFPSFYSAHAITADVGIAETAKAAEFFQCDGVILTGTATGQPPSFPDLKGEIPFGGVPVQGLSSNATLQL